MKISGIICEYNPLHCGHVYHINKIRQHGASHIVCAMSGNFVQRGEPALLDKWTRADIAVKCGADLVVDIPVPFCCDSAQNFAAAGVKILTKIGIDELSFGCETDDTDLMKRLALALDDENTAKAVKKHIADGKSYPRAVSLTLSETYGKAAADILATPNNTLAAEYIRAINKIKPSCGIFAVKRNDDGHFGSFSSAAIRSTTDFSTAKKIMPPCSYEETAKLISSGFAVKNDEYSQRPLLAVLRTLDEEKIKRLLGDDNGLSQRIYSAIRTENSIDDILSKAKTKCVTLARLRRSLIRLCLEVPAELSVIEPPYIKVLAANEKGLEIIKNAGKQANVVTRHSQIMAIGDKAREVYKIQCRSTDLYMSLSKKIRPCGLEQKTVFNLHKA